jgi:selenocysteine-specific elongation factor
MNNIIVGTAGHIDHGKTTLVKALTGIDTDRLKEEKERGISIELGFASLTTREGPQVAFVDVPGHERFVRNMLAGASGIDVVVLVIAADEGIKPQTREHFEICRLLGIANGIVALTKADAVDGDWLELMRMEVEDFLRGTFLEGAPVVPVSAVQGTGLDSLLAEIAKFAAKLPRRNTQKPARLPVDRAFILKGHGTVVTGTLMEGSIRTEDELEVYPLGRRVRVRGLQSHGKKVKEAQAGQRAAVNLADIDASELHRGMVAGAPGMFSPVRTFDARVELLPEARAVEDRARVVLHAGAAESAAELRVLEEPRKLEPGGAGWVRLVLRTPMVLLPGDRFVLRSASPAATVGGGRVVRLQLGARRLRRKGAAAALTAWDSLSIGDRIAGLAGEREAGCELRSVLRTLGAAEAEIPASLVRLANWVAGEAGLRAIGARLVAELKAYHQSQPLEKGLSKELLRSRHLGDAPPALLDAVLRLTPSVKLDGEFLRLESHKVKLAGDEDEASRKIEAAFRETGLTVPALADVLANCGVEPNRAKTILGLLIREGKLVRVSLDMVFHAAAIQELKSILASRKGSRFGVNEFKDWTQVSRKYAIPLLEFLDREKVTRREGDSRLVL